MDTLAPPLDAHAAHLPATSSGLKQPYHLVDPSPWPLLGAFGAGVTVLGIIFAAHFGNYITLVAGLALVVATMAFWWRDVLKEGATPACTPPSSASACATA